MSLFGALSELVGGAILACAPACDVAITPATASERARFVSFLTARDEMRDVRSIVEAIGGDVWVGAETRGLAQRDLEQHVRAVAAMIAEFRPAAAHLAEIVTALRAPAPAALPERPMASRMAAAILARAGSAGVFAGGFPAIRADIPIREDVSLFLLDRTFAHLVDDPRSLLRFGPAVADFVSEVEAATGPAGKTAETPSGLAALGLSRAFTLQLELVGGAAFLADLSERLGLADRAVHRLAALIDGQQIDADSRIGRLEALAQWLADARAQLMRPSNEEAEVRRLRSAAAAALAEGDFEAAMEALRAMRSELRETRRRTEERLQDEAMALRLQMVEEAKAAARLAELNRARGEHAQAAELFAEAALALPRSDRDAAWGYGYQRADALLRAGREGGDPAALAEALAAFAGLVRSAAETSNTKSLAEACIGHGDALFATGERETGSGRLRDAVAIYQKAIQLLERERNGPAMLRVRISMAKALARAGERDASVDTLREAAQAFREAVAAMAAERAGADQIGVHLGLGGVLLAIEERQGDVALLAEAAQSYRAAIALIDRETDLERWGEAHMNLGLALLGLGEQEDKPADLEAAVAAFRTTLEVTPRVRDPRRWALTQMNLGNALAALGDRDRTGTARLDEAIAAYNAALEELLCEAEPLKWAITKMNLGTALVRLGERQDRRRNWLAAAGALVPALEIFEQQGAEALAEMTRRNLKRFQESWDSFLAPQGATSADATRDGVQPRPRLAQSG